MRKRNEISTPFINEYMEQYVKVYEAINTGALTGVELLEIQQNIFDIIEKLIVLAKDKQLYECINFEYIIHSWRFLVNNILAVYIIGVEPINMRKLSTNQYGNDNYNAKNIESYLKHARLLLNEHESLIVVINDLCAGNIEWGDIIIKDGNEISGVEIKSNSKKNLEIVKTINDDIDISSLRTEKDKKQYERFLRQKQKMEHISSRLNMEGILVQAEGVALPMIIPWLNDYSEAFGQLCETAESRFFQEKVIDECIKIISINQSVEEVIKEGSYEEAFLLLMQYESELEAYFDFCERCDRAATKGENIIITYNEVLEDVYSPKPYAFKYGSNIIRALITGEVALVVEIDIEKLFDKIREKGYKVYYSRRHCDRTDFLYKNKRVIIKGKNGVSTPFSRTYITRIANAFYDTNALLEFIDIMFQCFMDNPDG